MNAVQTNPKGNINIPLGGQLADVEEEADKIGVTKTELGRLLVLFGLRKLKAGEVSFSPPALEERQTLAPAGQ